jgi:hypothetical protein
LHQQDEVMMWKEAIESGSLKISPTHVAQAKNIYPNALAWVDGHPRVGAIVVFQSESDFALGKAGLDYVTQAKAEGRLDEAYVVLLRKLGNRYEYVNCAPVEAVAKVVNEFPARAGSWGEFWWLPAGIEVTVPF